MSYNGQVDPYRAGCCAVLTHPRTGRPVPCDRKVAYAGRHDADDGRPQRVFTCELHRDTVADPVPYGLPVHVEEMKRRLKRQAYWS